MSSQRLLMFLAITTAGAMSPLAAQQHAKVALGSFCAAQRWDRCVDCSIPKHHCAAGLDWNLLFSRSTTGPPPAFGDSRQIAMRRFGSTPTGA